ncbi:related to gEgh 16 protein [Phialocephala subalpina]|uniref:Related to gEgh 16 protein n=1 Tax=Phialocephala subalpina TaxID=576137 RepID=A0A1L7WWC8_9HELO|nr:related to gEgh 16 protein [Phialocephala subalpina]
MLSSILYSAALLSLVNAHGQILNAQGIAGSPASVGFQVDPNLPRNCTTISPCQQDATLIRDAEIAANIVNECGRTELTGNIDVGENTENALAAGAVTQVKAGSQLTVTIHQVNADGAGPYVCDLDETGNSLATGQTNLTVTNNVPGVNGFSQAKFQDFNMTVTMPSTLNCQGASTGNVCTVRCRNNALAGPFGGCFAVQQTDTTAKTNVASTISTAQTLEGINAQIEHNQADLGAAITANQNAGSDTGLANAKAADALAGLSITSKAAAVQTPAVDISGGAAAAAATTAATTKAGKGSKATATAAAASASTTAATAKKGKNNNKREGGLAWAKRMVDESS